MDGALLGKFRSANSALPISLCNLALPIPQSNIGPAALERSDTRLNVNALTEIVPADS